MLLVDIFDSSTISTNVTGLHVCLHSTGIVSRTLKIASLVQTSS